MPHNQSITGVYQHYKGNKYEVLYVGIHTETLEDVIIYRSLDSADKVWVRPRKMFEDKVKVNNRLISRFTKVEN